MIIQIDSREKMNKKDNIISFLNANSIKWVRSKMYVGDYTLLNNQTICIDTKQDVMEIAGNICGSQHERFRAELIRAKESNIKLIVLIQDNEITCLDEITKYKIPCYKSTTANHKKGEPMSNINLETLKKAMITMQEKYDVEFKFCKQRETGKTIISILEG